MSVTLRAFDWIIRIEAVGLDGHARSFSLLPTMSDPTGDACSAGPGDSYQGEVTIRDATREDMHAIHAMIHELAAYEGMPEGPQLSVEDLIADGFQSSPAWFFAVVAERRGVLIGYAVCNRAYSTWTRCAMYLEDLYVAPGARRAHVGLRLLRYVCARAAAERVTRLDWHVLESNVPALAFYAALGARDLRLSEGRTAMRLDEPRIRRLAAEHDGDR